MRADKARPSGSLDLVFAADGEGRTFLRRQYAAYPFHVCRVQYQDRQHPGLATLYVQSCSGGVYEGDRLELMFTAEQAAETHISTQSATVVHTMPSGSAWQRVRIAAAPGAYLEYLPDPQILFPGSRITSEVIVRLAGGGVVLVSDAFLQHDPNGGANAFSNYQSALVIQDEYDKPLSVDRMHIEGGQFQALRPGVSGSFAAQGTQLVAGRGLPREEICTQLRKIDMDPAKGMVGCSLLPNEVGVVVRVLAVDGVALKQALHQAWSAARVVLKGSLPAERRK